MTKHVARVEQSSSFLQVRQVGNPEERNVWCWAFWPIGQFCSWREVSEEMDVMLGSQEIGF